MARYLVVAHQTAGSPELRRALGEVAAADPDATFVLLVPTTPVRHLAGWTEGESKAVAAKAGAEAKAALEADGIRVEDVVIGDPNPVYAVGDEMIERDYDEVIVSTLPAGASRWLRLGVVDRIAREVPLKVTHVEASPD